MKTHPDWANDGWGWRRPNDARCEAVSPKNGRQCSRWKGHKGWHGGDNCTFPPDGYTGQPQPVPPPDV